MSQSIMNFAQTITDTVADVFIVMSRKAACFIRFLERHGNISFDGELVTDRIYSTWFSSRITDIVSPIAKVRILQYVLAEKLFSIWTDSVNKLFEKKLSWNIDKSAFCLIFPKEYYRHILDVAKSNVAIEHRLTTLEIKPHFEYYDNSFEPKITISDDQKDNIAVLQTKLIEPFTNLYFTKEKESRQSSFVSGVSAAVAKL